MSDINFESGAPTNAPGNEGDPNKTGSDDPNAQPNQGSGEPTDSGFVEYNGKKLSKEEVAKKLEHADQFIETLKGEREEDRQRLEAIEQKLGSADKLDQVLSALQGREEEPNKEESAKEQSNLDPDTLAADVLSRVEQGLTQREVEQQRKDNWKEVTATLTKAFGEKTNDKVREVAGEYGMTTEEAAELAHTRPKVFLAMFGETIKPSSTSTPLSSGNFNTNTLLNRQGDEKPSPSGYAEARKTRDQVDIYQRRLAEKLNS